MPPESLCRPCAAGLLPWGRPPDVLVGSRNLAVAAVGPHDAQLALAVRRLKFEGCLALAPILGRRMRSVLTPDPGRLIVPIPVHRKRLRHRPVGQANLLAAGIDRRRATPLLRRLDPAPPRADMGAEQRRRSRPEFALRKAIDLSECSVLLVDDVCTTGITLLRAAEVLWEAGAESVSAVVVTSALEGRNP